MRSTEPASVKSSRSARAPNTARSVSAQAGRSSRRRSANAALAACTATASSWAASWSTQASWQNSSPPSGTSPSSAPSSGPAPGASNSARSARQHVRRPFEHRDQAARAQRLLPLAVRLGLLGGVVEHLRVHDAPVAVAVGGLLRDAAHEAPGEDPLPLPRLDRLPAPPGSTRPRSTRRGCLPSRRSPDWGRTASRTGSRAPPVRRRFGGQWCAPRADRAPPPSDRGARSRHTGRCRSARPGRPAAAPGRRGLPSPPRRWRPRAPARSSRSPTARRRSKAPGACKARGERRHSPGLGPPPTGSAAPCSSSARRPSPS